MANSLSETQTNRQSFEGTVVGLCSPLDESQQTESDTEAER
jgi:hypothetical protein